MEEEAELGDDFAAMMEDDGGAEATREERTFRMVWPALDQFKTMNSSTVMQAPYPPPPPLLTHSLLLLPHFSILINERNNPPS